VEHTQGIGHLIKKAVHSEQDAANCKLALKATAKVARKLGISQKTISSLVAGKVGGKKSKKVKVKHDGTFEVVEDIDRADEVEDIDRADEEIALIRDEDDGSEDIFG
jgi:hypothetical protein